MEALFDGSGSILTDGRRTCGRVRQPARIGIKKPWKQGSEKALRVISSLLGNRFMLMSKATMGTLSFPRP